MSAARLLSDLETTFKKQKFSAALLVAFIDLYLELDVPGLGLTSFNQVLTHFPANTPGAATLILDRGGNRGTLSIRGYYDACEALFRAEHGRLDYPSCAPYATGRWEKFRPWLDALTGLTRDELLQLRGQVIDFVLLKLPDQRTDPSSVRREPPLFRYLLESFEMKGSGEPPGSAWQGTVFGFLRADNPHLQIEVRKLHTGSKRLNRIGDIDAWDGSALAVSAEAKHYQITEAHLSQFAEFVEKVRRHSAIGIVAALGFTADARESLEAEGVRAVDSDELLRMVSLWDPAKQRIAVSNLLYYAQHVEGNSRLIGRLKTFLAKFTDDPPPATTDSSSEA